MEYTIRKMTAPEYPLLSDFLYEAIFVPDGINPLPRDIIDSPSLAISLYKEYRGQGIGTDMMKEMLSLLKAYGYKRVSLSVQKANFAVGMYRKIGFEIVKENEEEWIMICNL